MKGRPFTGIGAIAAAVLLVLTRVPFGVAGVDLLLVLAGAGVVVAAAMDMLGRRYDWSSSGQVVVLLGLIVVPTSQEAFAAWLPHWLVAVVAVVAVHAVSLRDDLVAPAVQLERKGTIQRGQIRRSLPLAGAVAIIIALPYVYAWLAAPRFSEVSAWQGAMRITFPLLIVAGSVAGIALLRPRGTRTRSKKSEPQEVDL